MKRASEYTLFIVVVLAVQILLLNNLTFSTYLAPLAYIVCLILTPLGGLICTLISDPLPAGERRWGCVAYLILSGAIITFVLFILALLTV